VAATADRPRYRNSLIVRPAAEILRSPAHPPREGARGTLVGKLAVDVGLRAMCSVAPGRAILYMLHCRFGCINRRSTCTSAAYSEPFLSSLSLSFFCVERERRVNELGPSLLFTEADGTDPDHKDNSPAAHRAARAARGTLCGHPRGARNGFPDTPPDTFRGRRPSPVLGRTASAAHEFVLIATRDSRQHATAAGGAVATWP